MPPAKSLVGRDTSLSGTRCGPGTRPLCSASIRIVNRDPSQLGEVDRPAPGDRVDLNVSLPMRLADRHRHERNRASDEMGLLGGWAGPACGMRAKARRTQLGRVGWEAIQLWRGTH